MDIAGPAGALQTEMTVANDNEGHFAVLCHPHPQYGGNMHDMVLDCVADVLLDSGISCLRFNFRGTGASEGEYSGGPGEVEDLIAVAAWLNAEHAPDRLWLGGYSFGASIVWQALSVIEPARVLMIAPPVGLMQFADHPATIPVDVFTGDRDDYVDTEKLASLPGAEIHILAGADHFFTGHHDQLRQQIREAISGPSIS